jgi:hypothetical protein
LDAAIAARIRHAITEFAADDATDRDYDGTLYRD